jgi:hypothetical protein
MSTQEDRLANARQSASEANVALSAALGTDDEDDAREALRLAEQRVRILSASSAMLLDTSTGTVVR